MDLHHVFIPLLLSCTSAVLHGQNVVTHPEVIGYQGHDATLLCHYGNKQDKIEQVQWKWKNQSNAYEIIVFNVNHGPYLPETFLKDRLSFIKISSQIYDASIIIKNLNMSDGGDYSCDYTTFPSGSFTGKTTLMVLQGGPAVLSTAETVGIVTAVVLITTIIAAVGYLFLLKRRRARSTFTYYTTQSPDDQSQEADASIMKTGKVSRSISPTEDIEYATVFFSGRSGSRLQRASANPMALGVHEAQQETLYAQVKRDCF